MDNQAPEPLAQSILNNAAASTTLPSPNNNVTPPVPAVVVAEEKKKREADATPEDYVKAAFNQDSFVPGLIAQYQGHQFTPQEGYSSISDQESWKKLTEGILPEYHNEFLNATSPAQAEHIRGRLLQKQKDLMHLGDMGWGGNAARLVGSFLYPEQLALAVASGGVSKFAQAGKIAELTAATAGISKAATTAEAVAALGNRAGVVAEQAASQAGAMAVVKGTAAGAAVNAGVEKLRQSVNFEDSTSGVVEAALFGAAFSAPFAIAGARRASRQATIAQREKEVFDILKAESQGKQLTPEEHVKLEEHAKAVEVYTKVETGELPPEALDTVYSNAKVADIAEDTSKFDEASTEPVRTSQEEPFMAGSIGAAQRAAVPMAETTFGNSHIPLLDKMGIKIPVRWDLYAKLNRSSNPYVQRWAHKMIKDPIGSPDGYTQGRTASEEKRLFQRVEMGRYMAEAQVAFNKVRELRQLGPIDAARFQSQFHEMVTQVATGDTAVLSAHPDIAAELQKAANVQRSVYEKVLKAAKEAGVQGADNVEVNDLYVNRQYQTDKIKEMMRLHGEDEVARVFANAFQTSKLHGDTTKAKAFLRVILKSEFSHHMQDLHLADRNEAKLREALAAPDHEGKSFFSKEDIDAIIDTMFEVKEGAKEADAGNAPNLKMRMPLDETYGERMADGSFLKVSDMLERDARVLLDKYLNSMAGHVAMAKRGIKSRADFEAQVVKKAVDHHMSENLLEPESKDFKENLQWVRDIYDNITGRPMSTQVFDTTSRISNVIRAYSRSAYLGQLGIPAMGELKQTMALTSLRAVYLQSGSFASLLKSLRSGKIANHQLAREVEMYWAFGQEKVAAYARQHHDSEYTYDRTLSKWESGANKLSHAVDTISGNSSITSATRQLSAMAFIQHHYDLATGLKKLTDSKMNRLAHQGLKRESIEEIFGDLKKYATVDATNGRVETVNWARWKQEKPESFEQFHLAIERETRDAIQDHDLGETIPFFHTQIGKIIGELRTFMMVAHTKNFLKNVSYMDKTTFSVWIHGLVGEALMYSIQTNLNFAHNPEELKKRMTLERISAAAIQRASAFGLLPSVLSTGYWMGSGGQDMFGNVGTANTDNRNLFKTPSGMLLSNAVNSTKTIGGVLNPWSDTVTTKQEMRELFSILPGGNTYGMRNLQDYISSQFPKHELPQQ